MRPRDERGVATVLGLALVLVLVTVCVAVAGAVGIVHTHRRAESAADLAALAGAGALARGRDGCAAAGRIAERNGAVLARCRVAGPAISVDVRVDGARLLGQQVRMHGRARAGPVAIGP